MPRVSAKTKQATREKLLLAAADEFARAGIDGANINRISLAAGLAKGTVYNYFDSKEALFMEVVREACARAAAEITIDETTSTAEALRQLVAHDVSWVHKHEAFARVVTQQSLNPDPARHGAVLEAATPFMVKAQDILERGQARGDVRDDKPTVQLALLFAGLLELAYVQHWGSGGAWPTFEEIPAMVVDYFLGGAAPRQPPDGI